MISQHANVQPYVRAMKVLFYDSRTDRFLLFHCFHGNHANCPGESKHWKSNSRIFCACACHAKGR